MATTFIKNITIELYGFYVLRKYVKFRGNQMLYTTQFINIFFIYNSRLQKFEI